MPLNYVFNYTKPFPWKKKGLLFQSNIDGLSHGSHPCAIHYKDDIFILAFTMRDYKQRSQIFLSYARVSNGTIELLGEPKLTLSYGEPGYFDCDGVISGAFVKNNDSIYLYYVGWQNLPEKMWICDTGRAILNPHTLTLEKEFTGPVLGRDKTNPLFAAATAFYIKNGLWHTWYNSGISWERTKEGWHHKYGFHHAESTDGVNWVCDTKMCIPFADEYEYAFGRPSVYFYNGTYNMWFAHRATKYISTYRIGFASSKDGIHWNRNDSISGLDVSPSGWDSEMVCYPYVFEHKDILYMLYNGNGYGKTGFGLAVLEEE
ncbi:hypothetical protein [Desulfovibrio litoralis]|uniref:Glycosyl hydrolases family 32 N-terminal domain-containing protein n=1 Tax=Desulfovibrio litoralis DSM 11393 TaxID=1121455 RepID=A0A1M7T274_9BACT|nr:hypothetical protein [Desulfovibrio litoralis]SHN64789.1 hypothetical protein SAMN02745728_01458 [Desulfovibrio litoralis DSM 11393]